MHILKNIHIYVDATYLLPITKKQTILEGYTRSVVKGVITVNSVLFSSGMANKSSTLRLSMMIVHPSEPISYS